MSLATWRLRTRTTSLDATRALAAALAELARPIDLLVLVGDLGAGKTAFVQGFGAGLGVTDRITSPTFALVQTYSGRLKVHHLDVYRIDHVDEVAELGLSELLDDNAVTLIEWGETIIGALPREYLEVRVAFGDNDSDRIIELSAVGSQWQGRFKALAVALTGFVEEEEEEAIEQSDGPEGDEC